MNKLLTRCDCITCTREHYSCPKCYMLLHCTAVIQLTKCPTMICFSKEHVYCPDCYQCIHLVN